MLNQPSETVLSSTEGGPSSQYEPTSRLESNSVEDTGNKYKQPPRHRQQAVADDGEASHHQEIRVETHTDTYASQEHPQGSIGPRAHPPDKSPPQLQGQQTSEDQSQSHVEFDVNYQYMQGSGVQHQRHMVYDENGMYVDDDSAEGGQQQ